MVSGQNKSIQPLLTIAIPTWNRSKQIDTALNYLLPQINKYPDKIEFIISDNASTDNTIAVVNNLMHNYPELNYQLYQQKENTGFFGNFHKCISLGTGKYFWLLSDDDFVFDGVIDVLIDILSKEDVGAVFLKDWTGDKTKKENFRYQYANQLKYFSDRPYRHSLISGVIYQHTIHGEDIIFKTHIENALIGYAVYLKAIHKSNNFAILEGNSLLARNDQEVRFNALWIFTVDLAECIKLAKAYYPTKITNRIANSFLETNTSIFYKYFKFYNEFNFTKNESLMIFRFYIKYKHFWLNIFPLIICPKYLFHKQKYVRNYFKLKIKINSLCYKIFIRMKYSSK